MLQFGPAGPDHEAVIRFGGEAPRRRAHSHDGMETMQLRGLPSPRIVIGSRHGTDTKPVGFNSSARIVRQPDARRRPAGFPLA